MYLLEIFAYLFFSMLADGSALVLAVGIHSLYHVQTTLLATQMQPCDSQHVPECALQEADLQTTNAAKRSKPLHHG